MRKVSKLPVANAKFWCQMHKNWRRLIATILSSTNMACVALKALTKAAGVAIVKAQKEAFDAVHKLLEDFEKAEVVVDDE